MTHKLAILYGGKSGEHQVSVQSAASVIRAAPWPDRQIALIGIDQSGRWYLQDSAMIAQVRAGQDLRIHPGPIVATVPAQGLWVVRPQPQPLLTEVVFPVLHGSFGEDGTVQGLLEIANLPYVGSGVLASALGMDKVMAKQIWQQADLPVVAYRVCNQFDSKQTRWPQLYAKLAADWGPVLFVKPARSGSSVGISRVTTAADLAAAAGEAFGFDNKILIEPAIDAREIEVSVIGNHSPESFPAGEIAVNRQFYDYNAKYLDPDGARLLIPAPLDQSQSQTVQRLAQAAYRAIGARGFGRVDLFLCRQTGKFFINEINTLPGFTSISMFPRLCRAGGLDYPALIGRLVDLALEEFAAQKKLAGA